MTRVARESGGKKAAITQDCGGKVENSHRAKTTEQGPTHALTLSDCDLPKVKKTVSRRKK